MVAAEFESTVVTLLPEILYDDPILSAVLAAERDSNFTLDDIFESCPHKLVRIQGI